MTYGLPVRMKGMEVFQVLGGEHNMIRLGMIGTGKIVHMFAQAALKSGNYRLEAVCSRDKERGKAFAKRVRNFSGDSVS